MLDIRKTTQQFFWMDNTIYIIAFILMYTIVKKPQKLKVIYTVLCCVGISLLFTLDGKYGLKLEGKGDNKVLRINPEKLKENCHRELYRYVDDTCYYNNIWRISLLSALIITLFMLPFIDNDKVKYMPYIITCLVAVIYHAWKWKLTHSYYFVFKTVKDVCSHLERNPTKLYKPISHAGMTK